MPLATTPRSIVDADRSGKQSEFHVLADGVSDGIRKRTVTSLAEGSASFGSGMMLGRPLTTFLPCARRHRAKVCRTNRGGSGASLHRPFPNGALLKKSRRASHIYLGVSVPC